MKKTPEKILTNALKLFNQMGVSNVRLQDIAAQAGISAGNLAYHYKTKKDLMQAVLGFMQDRFKTNRSSNMAFMEDNDYVSIIRSYLNFQIGHRFFYRDILEVIKLVPEAKDIYEGQMSQVLNFTKNGMYLAVGKGLIHPEAHKEQYHFFAKNAWAILNSWLIEREVLGEEKVSMEEVLMAIWDFHYPYLTEKGKALLMELKEQLPDLVKMEQN